MRTLSVGFAAVAGLAAAITLPAAADNHEGDLPGMIDVSRVTAGTYATDPAHTLVGWSVNHFGFNDYYGVFGDAEGTLQIDPANPDNASLSISIPITSVAVASEGLREHLLRPGADGGAPDFFGGAPAPATFQSTAITVYGDGTQAIVAGDLTMNGMTRPITIEARFSGAGANPMNQAETIGFQGIATIMRSDFGINYALPVISDEVELKISAAFEKQ